MPVGPIFNCVATLLGVLIGTLLRERIPERIRTTMPLIFGLISMSLGIIMLIKVKHIPMIVLATIIGSLIGELCYLEENIKKGIMKLMTFRIKAPIEKNAVEGQKQQLFKNDKLEQLVAILVLFSVSGMGIFGALNEGITKNPDTLISKGMLDFFTAMIFAVLLGMIVAIAIVPQAIVLFGLYFLAVFIMPHVNADMIANFSACGGIIMIATGLRLSEIKTFPVANMVPTLAIVMPLTYWLAPFFS